MTGCRALLIVDFIAKVTTAKPSTTGPFHCPGLVIYDGIQRRSMSSRAELHSVVPLAMGPAVRSLAADIAALRPRANIEVRAVTHAPASPKQRTRIWDLHNSLHCSIIGTCLTSGELRRLLVRLNVKGADTADDHDLHMLGVVLASRPQAGAKILQKTLDRRHDVALRQFARAKTPRRSARCGRTPCVAATFRARIGRC
jgi:hypothetical protein